MKANKKTQGKEITEVVCSDIERRVLIKMIPGRPWVASYLAGVVWGAEGTCVDDEGGTAKA